MQCNYYVLDNCHVPVYMFSESVIKYYYYYYYYYYHLSKFRLTLFNWHCSKKHGCWGAYSLSIQTIYRSAVSNALLTTRLCHLFRSSPANFIR